MTLDEMRAELAQAESALKAAAETTGQRRQVWEAAHAAQVKLDELAQAWRTIVSNSELMENAICRDSGHVWEISAGVPTVCKRCHQPHEH